MQIVKTFTGLMNLQMVKSDKDNLIAHLAEVTNGDLGELEKNWDEIGVTLILFDESDTNQAFDEMDEQAKYIINFVSTYPEYVVLIGSMVIALAILNDQGSGCYLAGYATSQLHPIQTLLSQIDSESSLN
ncbi:hypothetical protein ABLA17_19440 [Vibrio parahaemolyticus]|uniref:hypothetical protein n=1 Tax=Vibrio TaxID=662 RepID=UPI0004F6A241|nr:MULTISPECIES: hypothetical protein [Vibrio]AIL71701.1 hypothetical protein VV93_v1c26250 [Vibrio vulnificus]MBE3670804.1 hypothetical protein [Vibrio navarrensis]PWY27052.1 hypothetical protein VV97_21835 [Vibrio vulnificus]